MPNIYAGVCGLMVTLGAMSAHAQWVPVSSNIRFTVEASKEGKLTRHVKEGMFYRTEQGSTLKHWTGGDLAANGGKGELFDNQAHHSYEISYGSKQMLEHFLAAPPRNPDDDLKNLKPEGRDSVEGIPCDLIPIDLAGAEIKQHRIGYACVARNYGLLLKRETRDTRPDGTTVHTLLEMYNVRLNLPPDKDEFDILHTFTVVKEPSRPLPQMPE